MWHQTEIINHVSQRRFISSGIVKLKLSLSEIDWSIFDNPNHDANSLATFLVNTFKALIHKHFPLRKGCNKGRPPAVWYNDHLRNIRDRLQNLKHIANATKDEEDFSAFNKLRNVYKKEIAAAKKSAYDKYIQNSNSKSKDIWRLINSERNQTKSGTFNPLISHDEFNDHFCSSARNIINSLPDVSLNPLACLMESAQGSPNSFFLSPVTVDEVKKVIRNLSNSNCLDAYDLNSRIIKESCHIISEPLTILINRCFVEGNFPDIFKLTKVLPLFKKGDNTSCDNYRPISIVPIFSKIIENLIKDRLNNYLQQNALLSRSQFGFRKNSSTVHAVSEIVEKIVEGLEGGEQVAATLCDLSKAFDCVSSDLLIDKLYFYGVRGTPLALIESYLKNRRQYVHYNNANSKCEVIHYGVPQGSVLGPLLFIVYINDVIEFMSPDKCILFADDTTLVCSDTDMNNLTQKVQSIENRAAQWFAANKLKLNHNKTQKLVFSTKCSDNKEDKVKLLGIVLDCKLKWTEHVNQVCSKLSSQLFLLRQLKHSVSADSLRVAYFSLFHAHITYGILLWGNSSQSHKVFKYQKKAIRVLAGVSLRESCRPHFKHNKIMPLPAIYIYYTLLEIHRNKKSLQTHSDIHHYNTRSAHLLLQPKFKYRNSDKNSLDVKLYNKLSIESRNLSYKLFKIKVKTLILEMCYYSESEYMDCPIIAL